MIKVISEFSKKTTLYKFSSDEWHNMNTLEEYQEILDYITNNFYIIMMMGYTAVGKSTLAKKLSQN